MFQFPNGSIKSLGFRVLAMIILCFNSLMVRLKVPYSRNCHEALFCFNSLMVRLKGPAVAVERAAF